MEVLQDLKVFVYSDVILQSEMKLFCRHLKCVLQLQCPTRHVQVSGAHCDSRDGAQEKIANLQRLARHLRSNAPNKDAQRPPYDWIIPLFFLPQAQKVHGLAGTQTALKLVSRICHRGSTIGTNVLASTIPVYNPGYLNMRYFNRKLKGSSETVDRRWVCDLYSLMEDLGVRERGWAAIGAHLAQFVADKEKEWDTAEVELKGQLMMGKKMPSWDYDGAAGLHDESIFLPGQGAIPSSLITSILELSGTDERAVYLSTVERVLPKLRKQLTHLYLKRLYNAPKASKIRVFRPKRMNATKDAIDTSLPNWWLSEHSMRNIAESINMAAEWNSNKSGSPVDLTLEGNPLAQDWRTQSNHSSLVDLAQRSNPFAKSGLEQNPLYQATGERVAVAAEKNLLRVSIEKAETPVHDNSGEPIGGSSTSSDTPSGSSSRSISTTSNLNSSYGEGLPHRHNKRRASSSFSDQNEGKRPRLLSPAVSMRNEDTEMGGMNEGEEDAPERKVSWVAKHFAETYPSSSPSSSSAADFPATSVHAATPRPFITPSLVYESDLIITNSNSVYSKSASPHIRDPLSTALSEQELYHFTPHSPNIPRGPSPFTTAEDINYSHMLTSANNGCLNPQELIDWTGKSHRKAAAEKKLHFELLVWEAAQTDVSRGVGGGGNGGEDFIMGGRNEDWGTGGGQVAAAEAIYVSVMVRSAAIHGEHCPIASRVYVTAGRLGEPIFDERRVLRTPSWSPMTSIGSGQLISDSDFHSGGTLRVEVSGLKLIQRKLPNSIISAVEVRGNDRSGELSYGTSTSSQRTSTASSGGENVGAMRGGMASSGSGQSTPNALLHEYGTPMVKVPRPKWVPRKLSSADKSAVERREQQLSGELSSTSTKSSQRTSTASTGGEMGLKPSRPAWTPTRTATVLKASQVSQAPQVSCLQALQKLRALQASQLLQPHQIPRVSECSQQQASQSFQACYAIQVERLQASQTPEASQTLQAPQASQASQTWQAPQPLIAPQSPQQLRAPRPQALETPRGSQTPQEPQTPQNSRAWQALPPLMPPRAPQPSRVARLPASHVLEVSQALQILQAPQPSQRLPQAPLASQVAQKSPQLGPAFDFSSMAQWAKSMKEKGVKFAPE